MAKKRTRKTTRKSTRRSISGVPGAKYSGSACKLVYNPKTGVTMRGCYNTRGQFRFKGKA